MDSISSWPQSFCCLVLISFFFFFFCPECFFFFLAPAKNKTEREKKSEEKKEKAVLVEDESRPSWFMGWLQFLAAAFCSALLVLHLIVFAPMPPAGICRNFINDHAHSGGHVVDAVVVSCSLLRTLKPHCSRTSYKRQAVFAETPHAHPKHACFIHARNMCADSCCMANVAEDRHTRKKHASQSASRIV